MAIKDRKLKEKERIRKRIMNSARKIALKSGWHSVTIRKIADSIDYAPPIVYEHFENKEDLFKELVYMGFSMLKDEIDKAKSKATDTKSLLKELSLAQWDFAFNNKDLYQLMFSIEKPIPSEEMVYNFNLMKSTFFELAKNDKQLVEEIALSWMCLSHGAISLFIFSPAPAHHQHKDFDRREMYGKVIERFIQTI